VMGFNMLALYPRSDVGLSEISVNLTFNIMCDELLSQFGADYKCLLLVDQ
jgi:hypothetical protein